MNRRLVLAGAYLTLSAAVCGQEIRLTTTESPLLDVVSVRPSSSPGPMRVRALAQRVEINGATLLELIRNAFGEPTAIPPYRVTGAAPWMEQERFDIQATVREGTRSLTPASTMRALRPLLHERFKVRVRTDVADGPIYFLTAVPSAPPTANRLRRYEGTCAAPGVPQNPSANVHYCDAIRIKGGERFLMDGIGVTMPQLVGQLSAMPAVARPVVDRTGFDGRYEFTLEWTPAGPGVDGPSVFIALEEQFGLKLEPGHGTVERLVIEAAERPSPN